ncbi:11076_t:CDS:2, partial [Ambispora leptoticha]
KNQDIYKPHNLKQITAKISNDMDEKKKLQQEVNILTKEKGADNEEVQQLTKRIEELENSLNKKTLKHTEEKGGASEYVEQEMQSDIKNGDYTPLLHTKPHHPKKIPSKLKHFTQQNLLI